MTLRPGSTQSSSFFFLLNTSRRVETLDVRAKFCSYIFLSQCVCQGSVDDVVLCRGKVVIRYVFRFPVYTFVIYRKRVTAVVLDPSRGFGGKQTNFVIS